MKEYVSPNADLVVFDRGVVSQSSTSGACRCYLDIGVKLDMDAAGSNCWTDSEDATAYDMHDAGVY